MIASGRLGPRIQAILRRRSYRSFRPDPLPAGALAALRTVAASAPVCLGRRSGYAMLVDDERAARLPDAVTSGLIGKINPWLLRARPPAFVVVAGDSRGGLRGGERHFYNVDGAIAGQLVVLEAAGRGIGSCWVGGFHERSVAAVVGLPEGHRPLAVIPLGLPAVAAGAGGSLFTRGWDAVTQRLVSARRKPLERIAFRGSFAAPFAARATVPEPERDVETADGGSWPGLGAFARAPRFADAPVGEEALAVMLECARWAPSAENSQIARHVVVAGRDAAGALVAAALPGAPAVRAADLPPLAIASFGAPFPIRARTREQPFVLIDVPIAVVNVLAAAGDLGLGWQVAVRFDHRAAARHLGVPDDHAAVAIVGLGNPVPADPAAAPSPLDQLRAPDGQTRAPTSTELGRRCVSL